VGRELGPGDPARIGPYRLVSVLGGGGMGQVFLGRSAGGRPVAVKVIRADLAADREFRARFAREVDAARKVNGLYTALVIDADVDGPIPWLATAYVPGPSLADAVASQGTASAALAAHPGGRSRGRAGSHPLGGPGAPRSEAL
jgi:serine/threonine protein kinase